MIILLFLLLVILLALTIPIGISLGFITILSGSVLDISVNLSYIVRNMVSSLDSYPLLAVPLFILSGTIMAKGGMSERLFNVFIYMFGNRTAGIPIAAITTCLFYGAISGSSPATVAAVGAMAIPILTKLGYDRGFSTAMIATSGGLGVIIPPSIPFIIYGMSANQSVGDLFLAGILPGIIIGLALMIYAYIYCKNKGENKEQIMAVYDDMKKNGFFKTFKDGFFALLAPVIILGGIYGGIVTPTEAAVIAVVYALGISAFVYRTVNFKNYLLILQESIKVTVPAILIVAVASVFGRVLTLLKIPQSVASMMTSLTENKILILLLIILFLLIVGMIMETLASILILTPIFLPVVMQVGIDPIHFGVIMIIALAIGYVTPPVGVNLYIASAMTKIPITVIGRKAVPFIVAFIISLLAIAFIPQISLFFI
ncbi:TRAP transporter large permease [Alkalihalobacterium sp. APHAB7]|uniref:TRAP transporter large permease n=1 Tax=Alkalihalobacterium sp. APHAB7 TaxID=3402081 RepID=UPI003AB060AF